MSIALDQLRLRLRLYRSERLIAPLVPEAIWNLSLLFEGMEKPDLGWWALDAMAAESLRRCVVETSPSLAVEFGPGTSTHVLRACQLRYGFPERIVAFEHDAYFYAELARSFGACAGIEIVHAPIMNNWYDASLVDRILPENEEVDLLVVDGPPKAVSEDSRGAALGFFAMRQGPNARVLVDDTDRLPERRLAHAFGRRPSASLSDFGRFCVIRYG